MSPGQVLAGLDQEEFVAQQQRAQADLQRAREGLKQSQTALALLRERLPSDVQRAKAAMAASVTP